MGAKEAYDALGRGELRRLAEIAQERNAEIEKEKATIKERIREYKESGPLGSIDKHCVVDVEELSELLHVGNPRLADLWKRENINAWVRGLDAKIHPYQPNEQMKMRTEWARLPGGKRHNCKKKRTTSLAANKNIRSLLKEKFATYNARGETLSLCILTEKKPHWFGHTRQNGWICTNIRSVTYVRFALPTFIVASDEFKHTLLFSAIYRPDKAYECRSRLRNIYAILDTW